MGIRLRINLILALMVVSVIQSCAKVNDTDTVDPDKESTTLEITIDTDTSYQTIHSFGASDAWSCQFVGENWPLSKREQIADWLFSSDLDSDGNPIGIGLTAWRFNIGGGTAEQAEDSDISDEWRRAESFMSSKTEYNWDKQAGQRWFLRAAKERGVDQFIGFVNTPPVCLTKNGKGYSSDGSSYNLPEENYQLYATYLADVVKAIKSNEGIDFSYISPFNEPQWDWTDGGQEGTPAQNSEIYEITKVINTTFEQENISAMLELPESAQLNFMYEDGGKSGRGYQVYSFFDPTSPEYLGDLSKVASKIAGHSYYTTWPLTTLAETREKVNLTVSNNSKDIEFWMSEYCVLENNDEIKGSGRDLGINTALYVARVIFSDLVIANASSWQWWVSISPYDYKDGLVYIDQSTTDGDIYESKLMWALGNYSRFIKPGMKRCSVSRSDLKTEEQSLESLMVSAYSSDDKSENSVVIVNYNEAAIPLVLDIDSADGDYNIYTTDDSNNLSLSATINIGDEVVIPSRSIVTVTNVK